MKCMYTHIKTKITFVCMCFFIDIFVSLAIPSLQLRLTTNLFSNLDSILKTNTQYLSIVQCRVLVLLCCRRICVKPLNSATEV
jgi:hypothetical protein